MPAGITIQGAAQVLTALGQLQKAPALLGQAVAYATQEMQKGTQQRAHVLTGTYKSAQSFEVNGLLGSVFTAAKSNPLSGTTADVYGPIEEARGGTHAAYANTMREDAPKVLAEAADLIVKALP